MLGTIMLRLALALALVSSMSCANRAKRAIALYESGDYAGAARAADEGLAAHPGDNGLWGMKIRASLALGDAPAIARAYEQYFAERGDHDAALLRDLAAATIGQALASPSVRLKIAAIEAVAALELHDLADQVAQRMEDRDDRVAAAAAVAVLKGYPEAPQVADAMLRSDNAEARRIAVEGIAKKVGRLALTDLEKAADDRDPRVRRAAIRWLGMLKDQDAVALLAKRLKDPDDSVRAAAASALARLGVGNLPAFAAQALSDRALGVRLAGVELYAAVRATDQLVALVDDKDPMVATMAAIAVKRTRPELGERALARAIAASEWTIRAGAANLMIQALGKIGARPLAQRLLADAELPVRLAAARVLVQTGDREEARRAFGAALADAEHGIQAATDLARLGDPAGSQALSAMVRDPAKTPEQRAAAALAHRAAHRVTPGLVAALADASGLVRIEAAAALGALAK